MRIIALGMVLSFSVFVHADLPTSASQFCENLKRGAPKRADAQSLKHVREALGISSLGITAKGSRSQFEANGFKDLLSSNPDLLKDESKIPDGAVFILDSSQAPGCPVSKAVGHVPVKCGPNQLYWVAGQTRDLSGFIGTNPKCIKAVMYNPSWDKAAGANVQKPTPGGGAQ